MKTHKDDSDEDTVVNKSVKATYGQQTLNGVPPQGNDTSAPNNGMEKNLSNDTESTIEARKTTLQGEPTKETKQCDPKTTDPETKSATTNLHINELQGVPDALSTRTNDSTAINNVTLDAQAKSPAINQSQLELHGVSIGTTASTLDTSLISEDANLPVIEQSSTSPHPRVLQMTIVILTYSRN